MKIDGKGGVSALELQRGLTYLCTLLEEKAKTNPSSSKLKGPASVLVSLFVHVYEGRSAFDDIWLTTHTMNGLGSIKTTNKTAPNHPPRPACVTAGSTIERVVAGGALSGYCQEWMTSDDCARQTRVLCVFQVLPGANAGPLNSIQYVPVFQNEAGTSTVDLPWRLSGQHRGVSLGVGLHHKGMSLDDGRGHGMGLAGPAVT